jgi:hypothetical protein
VDGEFEIVVWVMEDYFTTILLMLLHALRMQTIAKLLGSLDPLFSIFH